MIGVTVVAYVIALRLPESIFTVAVQYAFTGFAALSPLLVAALFWRGSTKWGALASTLWVAIGVLGIAAFNTIVPAPPPGQATAVWSLAGQDVLVRTAGGLSVLGLLPGRPDGPDLGAADARRLGAHAQAQRRDDRALLSTLGR